jgi:hypothetical protein
MKSFRYRRSTILVGVSFFILGWAMHGSLNGGCLPFTNIQQRLRLGVNTTRIRLPSKSPRDDGEQNQIPPNITASTPKASDTIQTDPSVAKSVPQNFTSPPPAIIITESTILMQKMRTYRSRMNLSLPLEAKQHPDSPFMGAVDEVSHVLCSKTIRTAPS